MVNLSAMQTSNKNGKSSYQNHEERINKMENHLQLDNRYYDHLSSYNVNMYFVGEFLYWSGENEGFGIGLDQSQSSGEDADQTFLILNRDFEYSPAFRVGLGFKPFVDWDMYFSYTRFHHTSKKKFSGEIRTVGFLTLDEVIGRVDSSFKIKYDILDLEFGRPFHVGQTFSVKTHVGLRGGWIKHYGSNAGFDDTGTPGPTDPTTPIYLNNTEKSWLIGPRAGFDAEYFFSKNYGFSIYGAFSGTIAYANVDLYNQSLTSSTTGGILTSTVFKANDKDDLFTNLQCSIGLGWGDFLTEEENVALRIRAGWEMNYWWDQYSSPEVYIIDGDPFSVQDLNEALLLQGFVLSGRLDF